MDKKLSLRTVGIIAGAAAVFAFLFGLIISSGFPALVNRVEASPDKTAPIPLVTEAGESPFTQVADLVTPAVVNISAERKVTSDVPGFGWNFGGPFDDWFRQFFQDKPRPEGRAQTLGSGFIVTEDGYVVTNNHVVKEATNIVIKLTNNKEYKGDQVKVVGTDPKTDLALLKIQGHDKFPFLKFGDSDKIRVGDWAIAVGDPFNLEGTLTVGVISAKGRSGIPLPEGPSFQNFLQTDAAINPGNSGGPLVNIRGEVIGINSAITTTSGGNVGIGFAIPVNMAKTVIDELKTKGKVTRGYLGVYLQEITAELKDGLKLPTREGVLVSDVSDGTPASRAGLKSGDVITEFDGNKVKDVESFRFMVAATAVGKTVNIKVIRDGKEKAMTVKIGELPEEAVATNDVETQQSELGIKVVAIGDPGAGVFNVRAKTGVVVIGVNPGSPAADAGITPGDVITTIGRREIKNLNDYRQALAEIKKGQTVVFQVQQQERKRYIAITP
jgi:serine protease Do